MVALKLLGKKPLAGNQVGQATLEYVLLTAIVVGFFFKIMGLLSASGWTNTLVQGPFNKDFLPSYQYGHPNALGYGQGGGPSYHPRAINQPGTGNFRIFYVQP